MTYQELIDSIRDLGFSDDAEMQEEEVLNRVVSSVNRAISFIGRKFPYIKKYEFEIDSSEDDMLYITMPGDFLDFTETPVLYAVEDKSGESETYTKFNDFDIETGDTIVINTTSIKRPDTTYSFRVFYKAYPPKFTTSTDTTTEIPLPKKVHELVPLLASHWIWLDDEPTKAAQYYNEYEMALSDIENESSTNKPRMRVLAGGI